VAVCLPQIPILDALELNLGLYSKKMAYIGLEFFGLLLKIIKDSFWNALTPVTQPYRFCLYA